MTTSLSGISVVIPCLNEEESIGAVVDAALTGIQNAGMEGEVIVVDNGSTDRSAEIATAHKARVIHEEHRGYGSAIRRGFRDANYDILIMGDADLTYDFTKIDELIKPILNDGAELVVGNRMNNIRPGSMPWLHQHIGNPLLTLILRIMFRSFSIRDAHCGLRAIRKDAYRNLRCVTTGMEFASEMIIQAIRNKTKIAQMDIIYHPRIGDSKLRSFKDGWRHLRFMMLHSPTTMLLWPGLLVWIVGLAMVAPLAFGPVIIDGRHIDIHFMLMGGLLNIASVQVITLGLLAKAYAHLSGLRNDPFVRWLYNHFTLEKAMLVLLPIFLIGVFFVLKVVFHWVFSGFGILDQAKPLFFGILLLLNSLQLGTAAYLFSIMALPRHIDSISDHMRDTVITDV